MTISVWRYSHLALAVSSFLLLVLASVTGIILAFQPVAEKMQPYKAANFNKVTLAQALPALRKEYPGITELSVDANRFVQVRGTDAGGENLSAYVDPQTGRKLGIPGKENEFFLWVTAFHRSLFIHEAGRIFIGLSSFLLFLITVSGTILVIQRQRGIKRFFKPVVRENFAQFYHVVLGRLSLLPIIIISLSGTYLSLARFNFFDTASKEAKIDFDAIKAEPVRDAAAFEIFKSTPLSRVESVEFPFSEDAEDYYTLKLKDREIAVNQLTGDILSEVKYPAAVFYTKLSLDLHTGRGSSIWAVILAIASANILFFIYSGFAITLKRRSGRSKNNYTAAESRFIILVGSENGATFRFASIVHENLIKAGEKSYLTEINNYNSFPNAEYLIIMTATYGLGDAPTNATRLARLMEKYPQEKTLKYSVLGFGSHSYPDFCKFAYEVNILLSKHNWAEALVDIHTVDDKSPADFSLWAEAWSQQSGIQISAADVCFRKSEPLEKFTVMSVVSAGSSDGSFTINLKGSDQTEVRSGDLLAVYPANDHRERLYSIGVVDSEIRLSVRLYEGGLGSGFLHRLGEGETLNARIVDNEHFHFPSDTSQVLMISNGTGIAPFLGMISQNVRKIPCRLYCGFRGNLSFQLHNDLIESGLGSGKLSTARIAFSREGAKLYVSSLISEDREFISGLLEEGGIVMICGSLAMQKDVLELLETICQEKNGKSVSFYQSHKQILTDCY